MDLSWGSPAQVSGGELAQRVRRFARSFKGTSPTQADRSERCRLYCRIVPVPKMARLAQCLQSRDVLFLGMR